MCASVHLCRSWKNTNTERYELISLSGRDFNEIFHKGIWNDNWYHCNEAGGSRIITQFCFWLKEKSTRTLTAVLPLLEVLLLAILEFCLPLLSARCNFESHSTHPPVKMGQSNMPLASGQPLPSATATQLQQLVTSSHSHHLSQKVCLFTKPWQTRHLPRRRVQSRSGVIWAWQWKMKAQTEAGALKHVSGWCSHRPADGQVEEKECKDSKETRAGRTRGLSPGQRWANVVPVWYTLICTLHLSPDYVCVWGAISRDLSDALWDAPFVY